MKVVSGGVNLEGSVDKEEKEGGDSGQELESGFEL